MGEVGKMEMDSDESISDFGFYDTKGFVDKDGVCENETSKCLVCGRYAEDSSNWTNEKELALALWDEMCSKSFCKLFKLEDSFQKIFIRAEYCEACHNILRDIDFMLRAVTSMQDKLDQSRKIVEKSLKKNYERISNSFEETLERSKDEESYNDMVKVFCETLQIIPRNVNRIKPKEHSKFIDEETESFGRMTRLRQRMKVIPPPPMKPSLDLLDSPSGPESVGENDPYDSDYNPPQVEVILKDTGGIVSHKTVADYEHIGSDNISNSDSSGEDWERTNLTKSKKKLPKRTIIHRISEKVTKSDMPVRKDERRVVWVNPEKRILSRSDRKHKQKCGYENCTFTCKAKFKLDAHVNKIHKGDSLPFHCEKCELKFGSATSFYCHRQEHAKELNPAAPIACEICTRTFASKWVKRKHVAQVHPHGNIVRCSQCHKMFQKDRPEDLEVHENLHKLKVETDPFACVICDAGFTNNNDLKSHVMVEHEPQLSGNKCGSCNKVFDTQKKLKRHILTVHTARNPNYKCPHCSFIGVCRSSLNNHLVWHDSQRNFVCDQCGQGYKMKSSLKYHQRSAHSDHKRLACHVCGKKFHAGCALKAHEESHNRTKSYICDNCGKAFMAKKYLIQHMRSHTGPKIRYGKRYAKYREPKPPRTLIVTPASTAVLTSDISTEDVVEALDQVSESGTPPPPPPPTFQESTSESGLQGLYVPRPFFNSNIQIGPTGSSNPNPHFLLENWVHNLPGLRQQQYPNPNSNNNTGPFQYGTIDLSQSSSFLSAHHHHRHQNISSASTSNFHQHSTHRDHN